MRSPVFVVVALVGLVACGKSSAPPPQPGGPDASVAGPPDATAKPQPDIVAAPPADVVTAPDADPNVPTPPPDTPLAPEAKPLELKAPPELTEAEKAEAKERSKKFWALVNAGRGLVRTAKDYAGGIAKYKEALEFLPSHPVALGEIGYANLLAGNLEDAERFTDQALTIQTSYRQRGMLHYNRGQILEKRGDPRGALNAYRSSWAARHNDTVKARIDELAAQIGQSPRKTFKALATVCDNVKSDWDCGRDTPCTCGTRFVGPAASGIRRAAILRLTGQGLGTIDAEYLAVEAAPDDWRLVGMVTSGYSPGAFGIFNSGTISELALKPLDDREPNAGAMVVLISENHTVDSDLGMNAVSEQGAWTLTLCGLSGADLKCLEVNLGKLESVAKIDAEGETPPEDIYGKLRLSSWRFGAEFDGHGHVTIGVAEGEPPADVKGLLGTWTLDELATKPGASFIEL